MNRRNGWTNLRMIEKICPFESSGNDSRDQSAGVVVFFLLKFLEIFMIDSARIQASWGNICYTVNRCKFPIGFVIRRCLVTEILKLADFC